MNPLEWFFVITAAVSVPAAMLTAVSWWNGRYTNRLIGETGRLIDESKRGTQAVMEHIHAETLQYLDRMDQRAHERHREVMDKLDEGRAEA